MLRIYEVGERGSMKGPKNKIMFKPYKHTINSKQLNN